MHGDAPTENDTTLRATAFLGAALRLGATFRFGAALRFAGALRFGAAFLTAFFLVLVAEIVVVGAIDVAANLRWRPASGAALGCERLAARDALPFFSRIFLQHW